MMAHLTGVAGHVTVARQGKVNKICERGWVVDISLVFLLAAFGGGLFGAAIGGLPAFIFTGFMVMVGVANAMAGGEFDFTGNIAFGPVFGPHISFAGGAAAAAFAAKRGVLEDGKDIATPLIGTRDPMVLVVGGLFGMGGYLVNALLGYFLSFAGAAGPIPLTDTVALTVVLSSLVARVAFGSTGLLGTLRDEDRTRGRLTPGDGHAWVEHQQTMPQSILLGLGAGLLSGYVVTTFTEAGDQFLGPATVLMFGVAAVSLILLQIGMPGAVTHHMFLPAAVATGGAISLGATGVVAVLAGVAGGILGALFGELYSRLFLIHGDTHIDPPAFAIFTMATIVVIIQIIGGGV